MNLYQLVSGMSNYQLVSGMNLYQLVSGMNLYQLVSGMNLYQLVSGMNLYQLVSGMSAYQLVSGMSAYQLVSGMSAYQLVSGMSAYQPILTSTSNITTNNISSSGTISIKSGAFSNNTLSIYTGYANSSVSFNDATISLSGTGSIIYFNNQIAVNGIIFSNNMIQSSKDNLINGITFGSGNNSNQNNTACGYQALLINTNSYNTAVGNQTLLSNNTGSQNTAVGNSSLSNNNSGSNNTEYYKWNK